MPTLRITQFSGEIPKLLPRLLPDSGSQFSENVRLDDGGLTPIRQAKTVFTLDADDYKTIFKFNGNWLAWKSIVSAVPGPVAQDRLYYTGDGTPKMRVGSSVYELSVPMPTTKLTATVSGAGTGDTTTRLYAYTWVTEFDEESEPCPISSDVNWQAGQTVTLSGFQTAPTGRGINRQRIYRSQSSNQSGTDLFFIEERVATTANYVDTHAPDDFAEVIPSKDWNQPPADLTGLIAMPNGMMAGFTGKQLCFCEPYHPHAWPEKYRLTTSYNIVGLGAYGTTVVAGTEGYPYVASGNSPDSMIEEKIEVNLPCINGRKLVDLGYSVAYPSNDGLVVVSSGGAELVTQNLFTRADWQLFDPSTLIASQFAGRYFSSYSYLELDGKTLIEGTFIIDLTGAQPFVTRASFKANALFYDLTSGELFYVVGNEIKEYDALGSTNEIMSWKSKKFVLPQPVSFGAILAESGNIETIEQQQARLAEIAAIEAYNAQFFGSNSMGASIDGSAMDNFSINGDPLKRLPPEPWISIRIYADGNLIRTISALDKVQRIPGNRRAKYWEIQVNGTANVEQICLASTARELNEV